MMDVVRLKGVRTKHDIKSSFASERQKCNILVKMNHQRLESRGENRPGRYLYSRFTITVLHAIRTGKKEFVSRLQQIPPASNTLTRNTCVQRYIKTQHLQRLLAALTLR